MGSIRTITICLGWLRRRGITRKVAINGPHTILIVVLEQLYRMKSLNLRLCILLHCTSGSQLVDPINQLLFTLSPP